MDIAEALCMPIVATMLHMQCIETMGHADGSDPSLRRVKVAAFGWRLFVYIPTR